MTYSIGEVSKLFNLSIHTLRYYEKEGLLPFVKRTVSGIRKFDETDIEELKIVECLKKTNMPLKDIRTFLDWCQDGDNTIEKRRDMFYERKKIVLEQIAELEKVLDTVNFKCWYYDTAVKDGTEEAVRKFPVERMPNDIKSIYEEMH